MPWLFKKQDTTEINLSQGLDFNYGLQDADNEVSSKSDMVMSPPGPETHDHKPLSATSFYGGYQRLTRLW